MLSSVLDRTEAYIRSVGYRGYDPYDALESYLFRLPGLRSAKLPRWGFQQVLRRLPFQIRPILGIRPGYNPVTLALAIQGYTDRDRAAGRPLRRDEVARLVAELSRLRSPGYSGSCWGYDFDWESRHARIPAGCPTVVTTGFVTNALYEAHCHYGLQEARELVVGAVPFLLHDLNRTSAKDGFCFSYSPGDHQEVPNATMKGARLLAQAAALTGERAWLEDARQTIRYVVGRQRPDGSWPYALGDARAWADHFHTCYILDCLDEYGKLANDEEFAAPLARGAAYYLDHFFTSEGLPRYYDARTYPIDATSCGQALLTLLRLGEQERAERTAAWVVSHMALRGGGFKYQIHRRFENRIVYLRWSVAWVFAGLSRLERFTPAHERT